MARSTNTAKGEVIEVKTNNVYAILSEDGQEVKAYLAGKMKRHRISVLIGDKVEYVIDEYGDNNRITKRL
jgi:translation initiation factor IF-1